MFARDTTESRYEKKNADGIAKISPWNYYADLELGSRSGGLSRVLLSQFGWQERVEVPNLAHYRVVAREGSKHFGICKEKMRDKSAFHRLSSA